MAQKLIVEGNDAIAIAQLCQLRGLKPPYGYETKAKFKKFVSNAGGYTNTLNLLEMAINQADLSNIGIIVDANEVGASARWDAIRNILSKKYAEETLIAADNQDGAKVIRETNLPKVGVWVMPDNHSTGYLEHFLAGLVPKPEALWTHVNEVINTLGDLPFNEIIPAKSGKALLHTWLAWKKDPGKPFGQAMAAKYFNLDAAVVDPFLDWFKATFELSE